VDEWGIWCDVEPGTNPGFLYQQNSLRDALIAALNFNIFNRHSARVRMANIAQTANVLQSVILTEGDKTVLTPTWHAFRMYTVHHDAKLLPVSFSSPDYRFGDDVTAQADICASVNDAGEVNITLVNLDANNSLELSGEIRGGDYKKVESEVLTASRICDCNTFDSPETVTTCPLEDVKIKDGILTVRLPSKCVARITLS
jgi:alpha-N-arabinofuranosidase